MPKTQQDFFNQIADSLNPDLGKCKSDRMELLLGALCDLNESINKQNKKGVLPTLDASKLKHCINTTSDTDDPGILAGRGVLTALIREPVLYSFNPKMRVLFVKYLYNPRGSFNYSKISSS